MEDIFQHDVFPSHSSKDKEVARQIAARLREDGIKVWVEEGELRPGDSIPAKTGEGLERSRGLELFMPANVFDSDWAQLESGILKMGQRHVPDQLNKVRRSFPHPSTHAPENSFDEQ